MPITKSKNLPNKDICKLNVSMCFLQHISRFPFFSQHFVLARKDSVPGHCYFREIEKFTNEHYEEGENYTEFLKLSCQEKVG